MKTWKKPLRTLSAAQLQSVAGGIIGILSGDSTASEYKPAESLRSSDLATTTVVSLADAVCGGGPHV